jgi:hypothetical protein
VEGELLTWTRSDDGFWCATNVHEAWRALAIDYALHRLRLARARTTGLLHPDDVRLDGGRLAIRVPAAGHGRPARVDPAPTFHRWWQSVAVPALDTLAWLHSQGVVGVAPHVPIDGRWLPPVMWFLPAPPSPGSDAGRRADLRLARDWLRAELRRFPGHAADRDVVVVVEALGGDRMDSSQFLRVDRSGSAPARGTVLAPSFLAQLTEAELVDRLSTVYRYRRLEEDEARRLGLPTRGAHILEVDPQWEDLHFPDVARPSPQEVWDALLDDSKTTPVLALSRLLPNPLDERLGAAVTARWIGVHDDQPFLFVRDDADLPARGFARLHHRGDDVLMTRKRTFTRFAGEHPALSALLVRPPPSVVFTENPHHREALVGAVLEARGVFAVQGPPGTGKTHLATEVVRRFLATTPAGRVLVCAKEHYALDHILARIAAALERDGVPFRAWRALSRASRLRAEGAAASWSVAAATLDLTSRDWAPGAEGWAEYQASTAAQQDQRIATLAADAANVVCCTTTDAAMVEFLGRTSFDLVIIEEAGKCYPSELLHALCLGRTVLMIGDQRQLPPYQERRTHDGLAAWRDALERARVAPTVRSELVERFGDVFLGLEALADAHGPLSENQVAWLRPFEYLFDRLPTRHRLEEQFRMEAPLSRVVGSVFYERPFVHRKRELIDAGLIPARPLGDALPTALDVPLLWIDTPHMTQLADATEDAQKRGVRDNQYEAEVVLAYLRRLSTGSDLDLVILTPYAAQKRLLLEFDPLRTVCAGLTRTPWERVVRTTDEYQGREAELTVLSLVRNNSLGARAWGFLTEPERLNVMFSRARFRQVVVGCSAHIARHAANAVWLKRVWDAYQDEAEDPRCARIVPAAEVRDG